MGKCASGQPTRWRRPILFRRATGTRCASHVKRFNLGEVVTDVALRPDPVHVPPNALSQCDARRVASRARQANVGCQVAHLTSRNSPRAASIGIDASPTSRVISRTVVLGLRQRSLADRPGCLSRRPSSPRATAPMGASFNAGMIAVIRGVWACAPGVSGGSATRSAPVRRLHTATSSPASLPESTRARRQSSSRKLPGCVGTGGRLQRRRPVLRDSPKGQIADVTGHGSRVAARRQSSGRSR